MRKVELLWAKWGRFCEAEGKCPLEAARCPFLIDSFIRAQGSSPSTGTRVWGQLGWMKKYLDAPFVSSDFFKPTLQNIAGTGDEPLQATVLEPNMVRHIPMMCETAPSFQDRIALCVCHFMVSGWLRFQHITRCFPTEMDNNFCWFQCYRGKHGAPFTFCIPRASQGFCAAHYLWEMWHTVADVHVEMGRPPPRGFSVRHLGQFNRCMKKHFGRLLEIPEESRWVSSYSLRKVGPTLADCIQLPWPERIVSGG